jgi:hypothetical protein
MDLFGDKTTENQAVKSSEVVNETPQKQDDPSVAVIA